ncbi:GNAT family N-acetyltransferase [Pedobacter hartonius]|uniref:Acetyltransferase (GNAT) domain-containing protein n=1 Tax=Pedobacter hartonius TaxID=425514 RepID=A0A1H3XNS4_9SPHI|nr:GNAT family N-acetyltransferase [Pedobacter hartonius]SEA00244.1 Acetyltransferase (GNAT) domain-containing protein [Pedobacter hartonius]
MEQLIPNSNPTADGQVRIFSAAINQYCREFGNWTRYMGIPEYDPVLAEGLRQSGLDLHFKISFPASAAEVFIPLLYFSDTGNHVFQFPVLLYDQENDKITDIDVVKFLKMAILEAQGIYPEWQVPDLSACLLHAVETVRLKVIGQVAQDTARSAFISTFEVKPVDDQSPLRDLAMLRFQKQVNSVICNSPCRAGIDDLFAIVGILGRNRILEENAMLKCIYLELQSFAEQQQDENAGTLLDQRHIEIEGELFSGMGNYKRSIYNPLHKNFYSAGLLFPPAQEEVFYRYFDKEQTGISIRPFDIKRDLQMVHQWFHSEHAKTIWKMDWPLKELEHFYRALLAEGLSHSYIGEVNGEPTFNFEVYWATTDVLGDYYEVLPSDYGTHLFIAPTDKKKKFPSLITQSIVDWLFMQPEVGRLVGEGSVDSLAALMNKVHVGFRLQHIIEMPHKKAYLNFCLREWYWEKFPRNKNYSPKPSINEHT